MPNAVVMTGYGPPEVLKWAGVPLVEPGMISVVQVPGLMTNAMRFGKNLREEIPVL